MKGNLILRAVDQRANGAINSVDMLLKGSHRSLPVAVFLVFSRRFDRKDFAKIKLIMVLKLYDMYI